MGVRFLNDRIEFSNYLVPLGTRAGPFAISSGEMFEIRSARHPPEILLRTGEVLFVEAAAKDGLLSFAAAHGIKDCMRLDIWELLLEPFVDTEFPAGQQAETLNLLARSGIPREEAESIRQRVGPRMLRYNAIHWEWVSLSHADVLWAFGLRNPLFNRLLLRRRKAFYDWCNGIAGRGARQP